MNHKEPIQNAGHFIRNLQTDKDRKSKSRGNCYKLRGLKDITI